MTALSPMYAGRFAESTNSRRLCRLAAVCVFTIFLLVFAVPAFAQDATIVGTVTDPSGSVVPNANITVTNTDTGIARTLASNADGQYVVPELRIGHYTVRAQAAGFKAVEQKGLTLAVGDRTRVDFKLEVGTAQEQVTVEAAAVAVQSESGEVSSLITGEQVTQLATNGRSMYSLASLTTGASQNNMDFQIPTPVGGNGTISFNGLRNGHNIYLLDGAESDDRGGAGGSSVMPSMDSLAEFRILASNYGAEYGLSSSATMSAVIKSGTKTLHASAWEFLRNNALDAQNFFLGDQKLRFHTFGFNVGGPIDFWKKEHKSFFFYNMEWRRLIQGGNTNQQVPDPATYGGDFSDSATTITVPSAVSASILARNCPGGVLPNGVVQGQPFQGNIIPSCMIDPNATALLDAGIFPAPTTVVDGKPLFRGGADIPTRVKEEVVRIDHSFNNKFSVFGHFLAEQISQTFGTAMWSGDNVPTIGNTFGNPSYSAVVHSVHTISPTLLNEIAFNYNGNRINIVPVSPVGALAKPAGFDFPRLFSGPNNLDRIPGIQLGGATGTNYTAASWPWHNKADSYQVRDDLSWTRGAHQFKIGASWAIYKKVQDLFGTTQGAFTFQNKFTGLDFADFLLGTAQAYNELGVQDHGYWNAPSWAVYFQDNWRVTRRLTLNLGLRWDGIPHTYEANNRMGNFYPELYDPALAPTFADANGNSIDPDSPGLGTSPNPILADTLFYLNGIGIPGQGGIPKGLVDNHWGTFGPRLGFAYDLTGSGKTVIRGGFGIMYERIQGNDMYNAGPNIPFSTSVTFNDVAFFNPSTSLGNGSTLTAPITVADITGLDREHYKAPISSQYSIGVQHSLGERTVLSFSYVGNQNRHQNSYRNINLPDASLLHDITAGTAGGYNTLLPFTGFRSLQMAQNVQNGHYNSFQAELRMQARRDLTLQAGYTLGKAIDPTTGGSGMDLQAVPNPYNLQYNSGRPSILDRTHVFFANYVYDLPFFRNSSSKGLKTALGGWQLSGIVSISSGLPLNITEGGIGYDPDGDFGNIANTVPNTQNRPNINGTISETHTVSHWFDTSNFSPTPAGTFGNLPFNPVRGPRVNNWNMSLFKSFMLSESRGSRIEFRAEFFNVWNHTQFNNVNTGMSFDMSKFIPDPNDPDTLIPNPNYLLVNNDVGRVTSAHDPRTLQLGLKLYF